MAGTLGCFVKSLSSHSLYTKLNAGIAIDTSLMRGIGNLAGQRNGELAIVDIVHKVGRTTGVRHGRVTAIELDGITVEYDIGVISFDNQIEIEGAGTKSFSDSGDMVR